MAVPMASFCSTLADERAMSVGATSAARTSIVSESELSVLEEGCCMVATMFREALRAPVREMTTVPLVLTALSVMEKIPAEDTV